jgi:glycosyltransferase involved in cell wall biosynthesis
VIVAEKKHVENLQIPPEVELHYDIPRKKYLDLLGGASFVVIPLQDTVRSIGQAALLEAMAYSKAVITAKTIGTIDYISHGKDGIFYFPGDIEDLKKNIVLLSSNKSLRMNLAKSAQNKIKTKYNKHIYSIKMHRALIELCNL